MSKQQILSNIYHYALILILLAALAIRGGRDFLFHNDETEITVTLENVKDIYPAADYFTQTRSGSFNVYGNDRHIIGTILLSSNYSQQYGYGGPVPLIIGVNSNLIISKVLLLANNETSDYIESIYSSEFIGKWQAVSLEDAEQLDIDVVSGATITSNAVIAAVKHTASAVVGANTPVVTETSLWTTIKDILFLSIIALSLVMAYRKGAAKFRTIYMILVLLVMGLIINNALSMHLLHGWLKNGFAWRANWQSIVVFILALSISFLGKRKFYCNYLCPMGALQELTNRFSPFKKRVFPSHFKGITAKEAYLVLTGGALLIGFSPELSYYEPFMFFSFRILGTGLIIFGVAVIITSLFFIKPWCSVCPTGCLMDTISYKKAKITDS